MSELFGALVTGLMVALMVTALLAIPSFFAGLALWVAWNNLLGAFVASSLPHVGFLHCWATAFCVGWVMHYMQKDGSSSKKKED